MTVVKKPFRRFLGVFDAQKMNSFDKKHLHAYLRGYSRFAFKRDEYGQPKYFNVEMEYLNTAE